MKRSLIDIRLLFLLAAITLVVLVLSDDSHASGDCSGHGNCSDTVIDAGSNVVNNTGGNDSLGLGFSGGPGDVDLTAPCLASKQKGGLTMFRQTLVVDHVCRGMDFAAIGQYDIAAMHFCHDGFILADFDGDVEKCRARYNFSPPAKPPPVPRTDAAVHQQAEEIAMLQQQYVELQQRLEQRPATRVVRPQPAFTEQQKDRAWAILTGDDEDE